MEKQKGFKGQGFKASGDNIKAAAIEALNYKIQGKDANKAEREIRGKKI